MNVQPLFAKNNNLRITAVQNELLESSAAARRVAPRLPQELIEQIIDELYSDLEALQACSLTASAWLPRSRRHLFNSLSLHPDNYATIEERFSTASLSSYIHRLWISCGGRNEDEVPIPRDEELTVSVLSCFHKVSQMELHNMRWDNLRFDVQDYFATRYTSLTIFDLYDVEFQNLDDLLRLVRGFYNVHSLQLRKVWWETETDPPTIVPSPPLHLRELMVYETSSSASFIIGLFGTTHPENLQRIAVDWGDGDDLAILDDFVQSAGPSLRTLEVDLSWHAPLAPLDLRLNTDLRDVWLDGLLLDEPNSPAAFQPTWIPSLLNSITSPCMIEVVFYIFLGNLDGLKLLDMEQLDRIFSGPRFRNMKVIGFMLVILPHPDWRLPSRSDVQEIIRQRMPRTNARGLLRFRSHELLIL
ncbi:unnamed protein product [Somion occarium]|uniref:F-box domain-containing protein n=1 Tax=Somion occarium TaxID=3059160 RepID=A0ABP1EC24_9APHY